MAARKMMTVDGNEAVASVAHRLSEVIAIYPITPSSPMGEWADEWAAKGRANIWGLIPEVAEMQSEGGASGAVHGSLQAGALTTTFTASQGLLLMIPNMYKIAGEFNSFVMHVSARTLATHALSIFGDHSDVMACRQTGFALLASGSVQEAHDLALVAHSATLKARVPVLHFFDGFRTSHEVAKVEELTDDDLQALIDDNLVREHRERALNPDRPFLRGTAQNPDTFFQNREAGNTFYQRCPAIVQEAMDRFAKQVGREYHLFDYVGHPEADRVIVLMGSGAEIAHEAIDWLNANGYKVGIVKVRLYRPFDIEAFVRALPKTTKFIAVLDRTKEPGAVGEPLHVDVISALREAKETGLSTFEKDPAVIGGRYGLSSKEFTPAMVKAVFDEMAKGQPKNHFTVGINDDVTYTSLDVDYTFDIEPDNVVRGVFFGLGADGTVGANKNSIKIIGEETDNFAQGYFVYDSKKSGAITISHLRFGPNLIRSSYQIRKANFVACHQFVFLDKYDVLSFAADKAVFLLNAPYEANEVWDHLPIEVQDQIIKKKLRLYAIDAYSVAQETGMGSRINTIMQTCFFAISGVLPRDEAIAKIKGAIKKTYGKKGDEIVRRNFEAVDKTLANLHEINVPEKVTATRHRPPTVPECAPDFVKNVTAVMMANRGDDLPVSAFPPDGTWPTGTVVWEKRNVALEVPIWDPAVCIQCCKCSMVCPHATIRAKVYDPELLKDAPESFKSVDYKAADFKGKKFTIQVAPEDCTGCKLCTMVCPGKDKSNPSHKAINMEPHMDVVEREAKNFDFFLKLPEVDRTAISRINVKSSQLLQPLFEFSGACAGCGETPYIRLMTQLFGDRALISNATGCTSIYGGNLPTTPYSKNCDGRGPAWSNSLFEDNAEFGFGFRLAVDTHNRQARQLLQSLAGSVGENLVNEILNADQSDETGIAEQRKRVVALRGKIVGMKQPEARSLEQLADYLVKKSVWMLGGDGWAYDIGYGGLDHVLAMNRDVNVLVVDTEVYSNTGGQQSKATPLGAAAKFAAAGKELPKKDLGLMAVNYGYVYVARVAFGANDMHTVKAFLEAESYPGPSLIIAYSHCIAHGYDLATSLDQQKLAVATGLWPLYRYDPRRVDQGESPFQLDSPAPTEPVEKFMKNEVRFRMVEKNDPERYRKLVAAAQRTTNLRYAVYQQLAEMKFPTPEEGAKVPSESGQI
jgi:pyruvate-ferredoxin/flavodoxin oxidoreductase